MVAYSSCCSAAGFRNIRCFGRRISSGALHLHYILARDMKNSILIIDTLPPDALEWVQNRNPGLKEKKHEEYKAVLSRMMPSMASSYEAGFSRQGWDARHIIANNEELLESWANWAKEKGIKTGGGVAFPHLARKSFLLRRLSFKFPKAYYFFKGLTEKGDRPHQIVLSQIKQFMPDILLLQTLNDFSPGFLKEAKKHSGIVVGQMSSPIALPDDYFRLYDMLFSSYPHYVEKFRQMGIPCFYIQHAFDPTVLETIGPQPKKYNCSFVGAVTTQRKQVFLERRQLLEKIARNLDIHFWGLATDLDPTSSILAKYNGQAWGMEMYKILAQSKIVINKHIDTVAKNFANNLRLYEATGMGAMLLTDKKDNLADIFEPGKEVETYDSPEELIEKANYYLEHEEEREKISKAGQAKTLKFHNYDQRVQEIIQKTKEAITNLKTF